MHSVTSDVVNSALNNFKQYLKYKEIALGDVTIPVNNYLAINLGIPSNALIVAVVCPSWLSNTDCFSFNVYTTNQLYVLAKSGTVIKNLTVRAYYVI